MKSYNNITLVGRTVNDSQYRELGDSKSGRATFTLAVDRPYKDADGKHLTDFLNIVTWGKLAEIAGKYVKKNCLILVNGRIQSRSYEVDNETKWVTEIVGESINILEYEKNKKEGE